jgi:hypothetical protein
MTRWLLRCAALTGALCCLTACASAGRVAVVAPVSLPPPVEAPQASATPKQPVKAAVRLLSTGDAEGARVELRSVLALQPDHVVARKLLDQIDKDPVAVLGDRSYPYTVKAGESLSELSGRFLGDPLLFYALARYNGLPSPESLSTGKVLRIPGTPKPRAVSLPQAPRATAATSRSQTRDPTRASKLRADALDQMRDGALDRAIALLREARTLDPQSEPIRRDLDRANRLRAAIQRS